MQFDDIVHRVLPVIGPLVFLAAVVHHSRSNRSVLLVVSALSLLVTLVAAIVSAWLGLHIDVAPELPEWFGPLYWWSTQWAVPAGYAIGGLSFLVFSLRKPRRDGA